MERKIKRLVVKVGTSTLAHETGLINIRLLEQLVKVLADIKNSGVELVLVTSGAIGVGAGKLGLKQRPSDTPFKQAAAAVGQCELMYLYDKLFSEYNHTVAQVLLTRDVLEQPVRKRHCENTFGRLLEMGAIPIVNENDTVAIEEIDDEGTFGDNDTLSAVVACLIGADALFLLSDIEGLFTADPHVDTDARLIERVDSIDEYVRSIAGGVSSRLGTGGMATKIAAAAVATGCGVDMVVLCGKNPERMYDLLEGKPVGTLFMAQGQ